MFKLFRCLAAVVTLLGLAACATAPAVAPDVPSTLVWPSPPNAPRIAFVRTISAPSDLGFTRNFWRRFIDVIFGETPDRLIRPMAVIEVDQVLYVADPGANGVHRFDRRENAYTLLHQEGNLALPSPVGLTRGDNGSVYVTDSALGAVFVLKPGAEFATKLALGSPVAQPTGIAYDPVARKLYVVDTTAHCIKVYAPDGSYLSTIGRRGTGDGEFNFPTMLWLDKQRLLVTDSLNFRAQVINTQGQFIAKFGRMGDNAGDALRQKGLATDSFGHIYMVDALMHGVQIFNEAGELLLSLGSQGEAPGEFWLPSGIFIGADNMIYVADSYNRRVQVFRYIGGPT